MIARLAAGRLHYAWIVVAATFVIMLAAAARRGWPIGWWRLESAVLLLALGLAGLLVSLPPPG